MNILMVGAHLDDVELGAGAMYIEHLNRGDNIHVEIMTNSAYKDTLSQHVRTLQEVLQEAEVLYGRNDNVTYNISETDQDSFQYTKGNMQYLEQILLCKKIDRLYYHSEFDTNPHHIAVNSLCRTAGRNMCEHLTYSSNWFGDGKFQPNIFFFYNKKMKMKKMERLHLIESEYEIRKSYWDNALFDRERYWGSRYGKEYAEGFMGKISI